MTVRKYALPSLVGRQVAQVDYELLTFESVSGQPAGIDQVSMAVVLRFEDDESARFHWSMRQMLGHLSVGVWLEGDPKPEMRVENASDRWPNIVGQEIAAQAVAQHDEGLGMVPWACRLTFDNGQSLVIALGELGPNGEPSYLPDSLLISDSKATAQRYVPYQGDGSAWGSTDVND